MSTRLPDGLNFDDQLSLLLGRMARYDSALNTLLLSIWKSLVWGPAVRLAPDATRTLIANCKIMIPYSERCNDEQVQWATAVLADADALTVERNSHLHDFWLPGGNEDDFYRQSGKLKEGAPKSTGTQSLEPLRAVLDRYARVQIRLAELNHLMFPIPIPDSTASWEVVRGEFDLLDGSWFRPHSERATDDGDA